MKKTVLRAYARLIAEVGARVQKGRMSSSRPSSTSRSS